MLADLVARGCSGAIRTLTGARALWQGCAPSSEHRVYYGNHASHGDFVLIWSSLPITGSAMACAAISSTPCSMAY